MNPTRRTVTIAVMAAVALCASISWYALFGGSPERVIARAKVAFPEVTEFDHLYPGSEHFITYFTGTYGRPVWNSHIGLDGRYTLTMQAPIKLNRIRTRIVEFGTPTYYVVEATRIDPLPGGQTDISVGTTQFSFGPLGWRTLVNARGDLASLNKEIKHDEPVQGFDRHWHDF